MNRRQFLSGLSAGAAVLAGCSGAGEQSPQRVRVPSLSLVNHEPAAATVTVVLTDATDELHLWRTVELDARTPASEGGTVDVHEFDAAWSEPRDYRLLLKWQEEVETFSSRVADFRLVDDCAPLVVRLDGGFQFSVTSTPCSNAA